MALARINATRIAGMRHAMTHERERAEAASMLEWMILPQIAVAVARALSAATERLAKVETLRAGRRQTMARASSEADPFMAVAGHFKYAARRYPDLRGAALA